MQITYILGAGASEKALPLTKSNSESGKPGFPQKLKSFITDFTSSILTNNSNWDGRNMDLLKNVVEKCIEFGTPDL